MKLSRFQQFLLITSIISILVLIFLPKGGMQGDLDYWVRWINWIKELGMTKIYSVREVNYFPIFIYILSIFGGFLTTPQSIIANVYYVKLFIVGFDIASVFVIGWLLNKNKINAFYSYFILFNPAFFYVSWIWGQIEALYVCFVICSLISAYNKKSVWAVVFFTLAFFSKLQAIIFIPILILMLAPSLLKSLKLTLKVILAIFITTAIVVAPFIMNLGQMFNNVLRSVDMFPVLSANAYNFWVLILGGANSSINDSSTWIIFSYKTWGIILFCIASAIIMLPFLTEIIKQKITYTTLFLTCAWVSLAFFFFNTQMHERYLQPTIALLGIATLFKPKLSYILLYGATSLLYILNLERVAHYFNLGIYESAIFSSRLISVGFLIVLVWGIVLIYHGFRLTIITDWLRSLFTKKH